jgi:hypothetical protein
MPIDQRHDRKILGADLVLPVSQQCRLLAVSRSAVYRKPAEVHALDHRAPFRSAHLPSFRAKKSFSTFNWPICRYRTSTCASLATLSAAEPPPSKTLAAPSRSCFFQL